MGWLQRAIFSRHAYGAPPAVSDDERRAANDAISHSASARARSEDTINAWERATARAWGLQDQANAR